jgi:O-antigen ligase
MISSIAAALGAALVGAAVGIASAFVAFAISIRRAVLGILLIRSACDPFFGLTQSAIGAEMGLGAVVNALIIGLAFLVFVESPALIGSAILPMWGGFLVSAFASATISPDPMKAVRILFVLASYAAVFALPFGLVRSRERVVQCLLTVMCSSFIPVTYAFVELATGSAATEEGVRPQGTFTHPNIFAFYLVSLLALTLFMLRSSVVSLAPRVKGWLALYLPIIIILIVFTKTRSAWIGAAIVIITYASIVDKRYLICLLLMPLVLYLPGVEDRMVDLESGNANYQYARLNSYAWRKLLWQSALDWLMANPSLLLGYGLGSFRHYLPEFFYKAAAEGGNDPHNVYLQIFFEMGTFGLLTFIWLFYALFGKLLKGYSVDRAGSIIIMALLFSYLIACFSDNVLDYLVFQWYFWFIMGVVCAWYRLALTTQLVPKRVSERGRQDDGQCLTTVHGRD